MVRHDRPAGVAAAALSCDCKARGKRRLLPLCASRLLPARLLWVWLCSVRARAARAEVRDTRVRVPLLLGTVAVEADCRFLGIMGACFSVWRFQSLVWTNSYVISITILPASRRSVYVTVWMGWFVVDCTRRGTPTAGRGTEFRDTPTRVSAAVTVARAVVPNFIDDGVGAFEHEARALANLPLLFVAGRCAEEGIRVYGLPGELSPTHRSYTSPRDPATST